jgi:hypothetical protein
MTVTKVTPKNVVTVTGVRYSLPKPFIQVVPQADGTIAVDVIYLPDSNNTYAIDTSSSMSSYTFQVALDQNGMLSAVEFKKNTSVVGQQVAASAGTAAAQVYSMKAAQLVATQTAVNTAQTNLNAAQAARDAAQAQLNADMANNVTANINADRAALAKAQAQYQDAQQVLERARNTAQFASVTATAGTPLTTSPPTPSSTGFTPSNWNTPTVYELPENHGAVLFAVNEGMSDGKPYLKLQAAKIDGTNGQSDFKTVAFALGQPALGPQNVAIPHEGGSVQFVFTRTVENIMASSVITTDASPISKIDNAKAKLLDNKVTVELGDADVLGSIRKLSAGKYYLEVKFTYDPDPSDPNNAHLGIAKVAFTVN